MTKMRIVFNGNEWFRKLDFMNIWHHKGVNWRNPPKTVTIQRNLKKEVYLQNPRGYCTSTKCLTPCDRKQRLSVSASATSKSPKKRHSDGTFFSLNTTAIRAQFFNATTYSTKIDTSICTSFDFSARMRIPLKSLNIFTFSCFFLKTYIIPETERKVECRRTSRSCSK